MSWVPYAARSSVNTLSRNRLKAIRQLLRRTGRERDAQFVAEGPQAVREALAAGAAVEIVVAESALARHEALLEAAVAGQVPVVQAADDVVREISGTTTPQGIVAVCELSMRPLDEVVRPGSRLVVVLASVRDPGNAGTVIRTADAAGADAVVLTAGSVDVLNPKCVRASTGSVFHLPVSSGATAEAIAEAARSAGLRLLAADVGGEADLDDEIDTGRLAEPTAWIFGNEAWGLPDGVLTLADSVVRVPIYGKAESLNLAMAAAVCLYASARAQRLG